MQKTMLWMIGLLALTLVGCGPAPSDELDSTESEAHLLEAQEQALERARAVEDQVLDTAEQQREAIDEQSAEPEDG